MELSHSIQRSSSWCGMLGLPHSCVALLYWFTGIFSHPRLYEWIRMSTDVDLLYNVILVTILGVVRKKRASDYYSIESSDT